MSESPNLFEIGIEYTKLRIPLTNEIDSDGFILVVISKYLVYV